MSRQDEVKESGISVRSLNRFIVVMAVVLAAVLLWFTYRTTSNYAKSREANEQYTACQQDASNLNEASDYLTDQVRKFVVSGDKDNLDLFFEEVNQTRRRELAVEDLGRYFAETDAYRFLQEALNSSNDLLTMEYYAMRLCIESRGYDVSAYPEPVQNVELTPEDLALSSDEKADKAINMVFGSAYQDKKDTIRNNVTSCLNILLSESKALQAETSARLLDSIRGQTILTILFLVMVLTVVWMTVHLVMQPLAWCVNHIRNQERIPEQGSQELRFLASIYNDMFEQTRRNQDQLSYEASHDDLTGLYNRGVFDRVRREQEFQEVALLLIDVDKFKDVNDTYGHDIGDRILKKVAGQLHSAFRSDDYVCRIGGDEFAVIMRHAYTGLTDLVREKMMHINEVLQHPDDDLPAVSLSIGVAFADRKNPEGDLYKDADTALYRVKNAGRADIAFY